ncbi:MAG: NAD(P) transhydrogenase subunit alpha [Deltaproteobacteria bacterium]|nr:NAD(P) transhydrogenase subunit alpha [Deltaproteobacteria bacterium]MDD9828629.1 NAD(P) transhydrogenase subunit alpha [Deltaproteobacteria bacterium]
MLDEPAVALTVLVLSLFVGIEVISKVPPLLHTPLMSGSNAISGIAIVGALIAVASDGLASQVAGLLAIIFASINAVGGFLVTNRMLAMFRPAGRSGRSGRKEPPGEGGS